MSVSMYAAQVNRLSGDLADLRSKLAGERKRLAGANAKSLRAVEALRRATTTSQFSSKTRDVERYQKVAAAHEQKAADLEKRIAAKQRALSSAQQSLDRARAQEQQKEDREAEKRRKADLDHLRTMEQARRRERQLPAQLQARSIPPSTMQGAARPPFDELFDVCLSFAGEQRDYVERIAAELKAAGLRIFYDHDKDIATSLWGRDLTELLDYVYREGSRFCLMFISTDYAKKAWTRHERRSALARAVQEEDYVLPARFDDTDLPGFRPTVGYVDLREIAPATLVEFVLEKLRG